MDLSILLPHHVDLHFHAGNERTAPLADYIKWPIERQRRILGIVDHFEYYVTDKYYPHQGIGGFERFLDETNQSRSPALRIVNGMEIELETLISAGLALDPFLRKIEYLLVEDHFTTIEDYAKAVEEARKVSETYGIPVTIAHPLFPDRIEKNFRYLNSGLSFESFRQAQDTPKGITTVLSDPEIEKLVALFSKSGIFFELNMRRLSYGSNPDIIDYQMERAVHIYKSLKEGGVQFSLGSDIHKLNVDEYEPDSFCSSSNISITDLGIVTQLRRL